jgi:hypothetical protein
VADDGASFFGVATVDEPLVIDPVINPTVGRSLLDESGFAAFVRDLIRVRGLL